MVKNLKPQTFDFDYKTCPKEVLFEKFETSQTGLSEAEAQKRLAEYGSNEAAKNKKGPWSFSLSSNFFTP